MLSYYHCIKTDKYFISALRLDSYDAWEICTSSFALCQLKQYCKDTHQQKCTNFPLMVWMLVSIHCINMCLYNFLFWKGITVICHRTYFNRIKILNIYLPHLTFYMQYQKNFSMLTNVCLSISYCYKILGKLEMPTIRPG